jgi:hypothetical protein
LTGALPVCEGDVTVERARIVAMIDADTAIRLADLSFRYNLSEGDVITLALDLFLDGQRPSKAAELVSASRRAVRGKPDPRLN